MNVLKAHYDQRSVGKNVILLYSKKYLFSHLVLNESELEHTFQFFAEL